MKIKRWLICMSVLFILAGGAYYLNKYFYIGDLIQYAVEENINDFEDIKDSEEIKEVGEVKGVEEKCDPTEDEDKEKSDSSKVEVIEGSRTKDAKADNTKVDDKKDHTVNQPKPKVDPDSKKGIVGKYTGKFHDLQGRFEGKLNSLVAQAKSEYYALSSEERKEQKVSLGFKYLNKARDLERSCDGEFNHLLGQMKRELIAHKYSIEAVDEAQTQYKAQKSAKRRALMRKAMSKK